MRPHSSRPPRLSCGRIQTPDAVPSQLRFGHSDNPDPTGPLAKGTPADFGRILAGTPSTTPRRPIGRRSNLLTLVASPF
jgi:hypothetical protein